MYKVYQPDSYYNHTVWLPPGRHTISTTDTGGQTQWHGGFWYVREASRDMSGSRHLMSDLDAAGAAGTIKTRCFNLCREGGFSNMGLQGADECFCDNAYGDRGQAPSSDCGTDGDACAVGQQDACVWRNAVFDVTGSQPVYQGCYIDSEEDGETGRQVASGVGGERGEFDVPYPSGIYGMGPTCGERYHDFGTFNTTVVLEAGMTYYMHAGGRRTGSRAWAGGGDSCTWTRPSRADNQLECNDGTSCTGWSCCR